MLPQSQGKRKVINPDQDSFDIVREICRAHKIYAADYDLIYQYFDKPELEDTLTELFEFCKAYIPYEIETKKLQTTRSPAMILNGEVSRGGDCKHYAQFIAGVLDAIERNTGKQTGWEYKFAFYKDDEQPRHVFVTAGDPGNELWIDPVLPALNYRFPYPKKWIRKKVNTMALVRISGVNRKIGDTGDLLSSFTADDLKKILDQIPTDVENSSVASQLVAGGTKVANNVATGNFFAAAAEAVKTGWGLLKSVLTKPVNTEDERRLAQHVWCNIGQKEPFNKDYFKTHDDELMAAQAMFSLLSGIRLIKFSDYTKCRTSVDEYYTSQGNHYEGVKDIPRAAVERANKLFSAYWNNGEDLNNHWDVKVLESMPMTTLIPDPFIYGGLYTGPLPFGGYAKKGISDNKGLIKQDYGALVVNNPAVEGQLENNEQADKSGAIDTKKNNLGLVAAGLGVVGLMTMGKPEGRKKQTGKKISGLSKGEMIGLGLMGVGGYMLYKSFAMSGGLTTAEKKAWIISLLSKEMDPTLAKQMIDPIPAADINTLYTGIHDYISEQKKTFSEFPEPFKTQYLAVAMKWNLMGS